MSVLCVGFVACNDKPDEPDRYVTEKYYIANSMDSDIVVELHSGEVIIIQPGKQQQVQTFDMVYEWGVAYSRSMYAVDRAVMKIDGEVVPESIWLIESWDRVREDGKDDYHYTLLYTLTVTDELLEQARLGTD